MPKSLCDALVLVGTEAFISMGIGAFVSVLAEYWSKWKDLPPKAKRPIIFGFCLVVPAISVAGRLLFCGLEITLDVIYLALVAGLAAFFGSQFAHIYKLPSKK